MLNLLNELLLLRTFLVLQTKCFVLYFHKHLQTIKHSNVNDCMHSLGALDGRRLV